MTLNGAGWQADFEAWLAPFLAHLAHRERRSMCPLYVAGLIGPGDRKSVQPRAERLGLGTHDRLHQFVSSAAWDAAPLEAELLAKADPSAQTRVVRALGSAYHPASRKSGCRRVS